MQKKMNNKYRVGEEFYMHNVLQAFEIIITEGYEFFVPVTLLLVFLLHRGQEEQQAWGEGRKEYWFIDVSTPAILAKIMEEILSFAYCSFILSLHTIPYSKGKHHNHTVLPNELLLRILLKFFLPKLDIVFARDAVRETNICCFCFSGQSFGTKPACARNLQKIQQQFMKIRFQSPDNKFHQVVWCLTLVKFPVHPNSS